MAKKVFDAEALKDNLVELKERMEEIEHNLGSDIKKKAIAAEKKAEHTIEEHPISSLGAAFGAGILAGAIATALMNRK